MERVSELQYEHHLGTWKSLPVSREKVPDWRFLHCIFLLSFFHESSSSSIMMATFAVAVVVVLFSCGQQFRLLSALAINVERR